MEEEKRVKYFRKKSGAIIRSDDPKDQREILSTYYDEQICCGLSYGDYIVAQGDRLEDVIDYYEAAYERDGIMLHATAPDVKSIISKCDTLGIPRQFAFGIVLGSKFVRKAARLDESGELTLIQKENKR